MDLREEILAAFTASDLKEDTLVNAVCYYALQQIKAVVEDSRLDDVSCFQRIERIICILEEIGSDGGYRHDFG